MKAPGTGAVADRARPEAELHELTMLGDAVLTIAERRDAEVG